MEFQKLYPFVLLIISVGMLIGVGVVTFNKFGTAAYRTSDAVTEQITLLNGTAVSLSHGNVTISYLMNESNTIDGSDYTLDETAGTVTLVDNDYNNTAANVTYTWKNYDTETRDATNSMATEVSNISSQWIGLIVTIFILSIIIYMVLTSFGRRS